MAHDQMTMQRSTKASGEALTETESLRVEIARLKRRCADSEEAAARHATMLSEGDHRIKNSLQIVSSLIGLQAGREQSPSARAALKAASERIQSVARIHDALQASAGRDAVDIGGVVKNMCNSLHAMAGDPDLIAVVVDVEPIQAPVALAQPIVLAVNELVVNALRHAFPNGRGGTVRISVAKRDDALEVVVADNGIGFPANHAEGRGYGSSLVRMLARQVSGSLKIENENGSRFTLTAPIPPADVESSFS
jgi:two-component sensor histidine kinase